MSPAAAVRLDGVFQERNRAEAGVVDVLGADTGCPNVADPLYPLIGGEKVLDRDSERTETAPKPAPSSRDAVIWERSV